jgi:hypothetical protein
LVVIGGVVFVALCSFVCWSVQPTPNGPFNARNARNVTPTAKGCTNIVSRFMGFEPDEIGHRGNVDPVKKFWKRHTGYWQTMSVWCWARCREMEEEKGCMSGKWNKEEEVGKLKKCFIYL